MVYNHRISRLLFLFLGVILVGCGGRNNDRSPISGENPASVAGHVYLVGSQDHSGIIVFLERTYWSNFNSSALTNKEGYYHITNVPIGTYTLYAYARKGDLKETWPDIEVWWGWEKIKTPDIYLLRARVPLSKGNSWDYTLREWLDDVNIAWGQRKVNIKHQEYLSGRSAFVAEEFTYRTGRQGTEQRLERKWLYETKDALFEYASETINNVAAVSPVRDSPSSKKPSFRLGNLYFTDLTELRRFVNKPAPVYDKRSGPIKKAPKTHPSPRKILAYPLRLRESWTESYDAFTITKEVVAQERIFVPAGEFVCYKVKISYESDFDLETISYEWYSTIGLIKSYRKTEFWETTGDYDSQSDFPEEKKVTWIESWELNYYRLDLPDKPT